MRRHDDEKIHRLMNGPLRASRRDAAWLASIADEFTVPADVELVPGRFAYVAVHPDGGVRVAEHAAVTSRMGDVVFVVTMHQLDELARRIPVVAASRRQAAVPAVNHDAAIAAVPVAVAA